MNNHKIVGLRFVIGPLSFVRGMSLHDARTIVHAWASGELKLRGHEFLGDPEHASDPWAVKLDSILMMDIVVLDEQKKTPYAPQHPPGNPKFFSG